MSGETLRPRVSPTEDEMYSYCLFCQSAKCETIALLLPKWMDCKAIFPKCVQRIWVRGHCREEVRAYLPGYVFLYTDEPLEEYATVRSLDGVVRLLGREAEGYRLTGADERFAHVLYANRGMIGILKAYEAGDRIRLTAASLPGYAGEILKVDRRKGRAQILIRFDGKELKLWAGFDLIDRRSEADRTATEENEEKRDNRL